jgi:hypothetical protein
METEIDIIYSHNVYSPADLAGKKGERRSIERSMGRRLIDDGYAVEAIGTETGGAEPANGRTGESAKTNNE